MLLNSDPFAMTRMPVVKYVHQLMHMAAINNFEPGKVDRYTEALPALAPYLDHADRASKIYVALAGLIPAPYQTERYARTVMSYPYGRPADRRVIDSRAATRLDREASLKSAGVVMEATIGETALLNGLVDREQLEELRAHIVQGENIGILPEGELPVDEEGVVTLPGPWPDNMPAHWSRSDLMVLDDTVAVVNEARGLEVVSDLRLADGLYDVADYLSNSGVAFKGSDAIELVDHAIVALR